MKNQSVTKNWLKVSLQGTVFNRNAFGATVKVVCADKRYYCSNDAVDFLGQSILPLHFGIADADKIDTLAVTWPNGEQEIISNISANQAITIAEGQGVVADIATEPVVAGKEHLHLIGNFPNPFNGQTRIIFDAAQAGPVKFKVYSSAGYEVFRDNLTAQKDRNTISWYGTDNNEDPLSSGLYFYQITFNNNANLFGKLLYIK